MSSVLHQLEIERKEVLRIGNEIIRGYHLIKDELEPRIRAEESNVREQIRIARSAGSNERAVHNVQQAIEELVHEDKDIERIVRRVRIRTDELDRVLRAIPKKLRGLSGAGAGSAQAIEHAIETEFRLEKRVKQIKTDERRRYRDERRIDRELLALRSIVLQQIHVSRPSDELGDNVHERVFTAAERFFDELNTDIEQIDHDAEVLVRIAKTTVRAIDTVVEDVQRTAA